MQLYVAPKSGKGNAVRGVYILTLTGTGLVCSILRQTVNILNFEKKRISIYNKNVRKCYLEAEFHNSESTFFSSTFKVEEKKVLSEMWFSHSK